MAEQGTSSEMTSTVPDMFKSTMAEKRADLSVDIQLRESAEREIAAEPYVIGGLQSCSDEDLVAAARSGNRSALEKLLLQHYPIVLRTARHLCANAEDAEDVVQETMMRAFIGVGEFRGEARFSTWLASIATNAALTIRRKHKCRRWVYLDEPTQPDDPTCMMELREQGRDPEQKYLLNELCALVRRSISKQVPKFRFILRAYYFDDRSLRETALALGITEGAVKSRLFHARRKLMRTFCGQEE